MLNQLNPSDACKERPVLEALSQYKSEHETNNTMVNLSGVQQKVAKQKAYNEFLDDQLGPNWNKWTKKRASARGMSV